MNQREQQPLRPSDWARLVLASGDLLPRHRARDQQADVAGNQLLSRVLCRVVELDPKPARLAKCLDEIVCELGDPPGPARAIARNISEEFDAACQSPTLVAWLVEQAVARSQGRTEILKRKA